MKHRRFIALFFLAIFLIQGLLVVPANAELLVVATRDDIYKKLEEAAKINAIVNTLTKCFNAHTYNTHIGQQYGTHDRGFSTVISDSLEPTDMSSWLNQRLVNVYDGKIFSYRQGWNNNTSISLPLWLEKEIETGEQWDKDGRYNEKDGKTGSIWCWYGQDLGHSIFQLFAKAIRTGDLTREVTADDYYRILCSSNPSIFIRTEYEYPFHALFTWKARKDLECGAKTPLNGSYSNYYLLNGDSGGGNKDWREGLKQIYEDYRTKSGNQYLPNWENLGSFNNVDGYFNYIMDFNNHCSGTIQESEGNGALPITKYEKEEERIVAKTIYIKVDKDNKWDYPLSDQNPVTTCPGLLKRIEELRVKYNGSSNTIGDDRQYGYEGVILSKLNDACKNIVDSQTGENGWESLKQKLQEIINDPAAAQTQKDNAQNSLNAIKKAEEEGIYFESKGEETDKNGKIHACINLDEIETTVEDYEYGSEDMGEGDEDSTGDKELTCYDNAGVLGWILCPVIEAARYFIVVQYSAIVEPALRVDSQLFTSDENNGTYKAWSIFRDLANVLFVIFCIFVVFSQVTGVGIDNYGIKKILPKLILAVILINLSYVVCQFAIDICNIVGNGIGGLFQRLAGKIPSTISLNGGENIGKTKISGWGESYLSNFWGNTALVTIVLALGVGVVLTQGLAIIIPILLLVLSVVIAIVGLIVILGVRQAAAVLLVVVSPLAFACYILPNTNKIFDKWFKAFQALLVAYPVCSALVYGGDLVARILLQAADGEKTNNAWILISAAAVSVAPIFFIPKIIIGSVGAISQGIMGFSNRVSRRATGSAGRWLESTRLTDRRNYNRNMRAQKSFARTGAYNAKRGRRIVDKYTKKHMNSSNMNAIQRRKYNIAKGAINAQNQDLEDAYRTDFSNKEDSEIVQRLMNAAQNDKLDENMLVGGLSAIKHENQLTDALRQISGTKAYRDLVHGNRELTQRIGGVMASRGPGSVINQSIGKIMSAGQDIRTDSGAWDTNELRKKVQGAGSDVMAAQDMDVFNTAGAADLLSNEQIRAAAAAGYSGNAAKAFHGMMSGVDIGRKEQIAASLTAEDVTSLSMQTSSDGKEIGSLDALGGADVIIRKNPTAIKTLNSDDGARLRNRMGSDTMQALKIKHNNSESGNSVDIQSKITDYMHNNGGGNNPNPPASGGLEDGTSINIDH